MNLMNGWLWIVVALVLAALELALPTWFFLGAAIAVGLMGIALLIGLWGGGLPLALVVTAILTGVIWLILRRIYGTSRGEVTIWDRDINDN
jgi:membrane protein implicated in regulation of membrane protease activity